MSPPSTARSPIHGRPPLGWGGLGGNNGWIAAHTSSGTNCSAMLNGAADDELFVMLHNYTPSRCETSSKQVTTSSSCKRGSPAIVADAQTWIEGLRRTCRRIRL